ncbi:MAG: 2-hydroxyacyl-CoA dehydratase family protein, partial [Dehalococcoidales bacterium]|nr:2-hydroxyacyl-CoA dehydratase family protein [Dehalococcoidales bacterium]
GKKMTIMTSQQTSRIEELKKAGYKVVGYYCCYIPVELFTAARVIPYRILGNPKEQISQADEVLEGVMCPWVRNTLDQALKGNYSFLDGMVVPHVCDAVQRMFGFWRHYLKLSYNQYLDIPHVFSASSFKFFAQELAHFKEGLEGFIGYEITDKELRNAIELHNENRRLVQELYSLRKADPSPVSSVEVLRLLKAGLQGMAVEDFNQLLRDSIAEIKSRLAPKEEAKPRLLLSGCVVDDEPLFQLAEDSGAHIVMDDLAVGTRTFWFQVKPGKDLMASLSRAYLEGVRCPRTVVSTITTPYKERLGERFSYLTDYAKEYNVKGFILNLLRYCDCHEFDFPDLRDHLQSLGYPVLILDDDYTVGSIQRVKTRIEAFVETMKTE